MHRRLVVPAVLVLTSCIFARSVQIDPVRRPAAGDSVLVTSPVKAHLLDGSTVVFGTGVRVQRDTVWGAGMRYDISLRDSTRLETLALDSVIGMESFRTEVDNTRTVIYSTLATLGTLGAIVAIACIADPKCFGSCPTYYADSAGTPVLEAEGFSYSIAELFEARDVDRLRVGPDASGALRLEVRNEAFETHFINHLELLDVAHEADEVALPDQHNEPVVVRGVSAVASARARSGRDIQTELAAADGHIYRTDSRVVEAARIGDLEDWLDLVVPAPAGADSVVVVFRMRNSLLNTILFYDIMLGDPGARSLDWVGQQLQQIGPAVELAQWYQRRMGMSIAVRTGATWGPAGRLKDTGPVAWKDVAVVVPVLEADSVRVRLAFPADNWRIDRIGVATSYRRPTPVIHRLARVDDSERRADTTARAAMAGADNRYLETRGGQWFSAEFRPGAAAAGRRTFFLASQGYYTEWVRNGWLTAPRVTRTFVPSDTALAEAIARWRVTQDTLEARFMATRVPVR
jgi:hypothetical protein